MVQPKPTNQPAGQPACLDTNMLCKKRLWLATTCIVIDVPAMLCNACRLARCQRKQWMHGPLLNQREVSWHSFSECVCAATIRHSQVHSAPMHTCSSRWLCHELPLLGGHMPVPMHPHTNNGVLPLYTPALLPFIPGDADGHRDNRL